MRILKGIANSIRNSKGVATSLVEATATVAIGAVLAAVAVGNALDAIDNSKVQAAIADVSIIGQGMISFYKDNSFFPMFVDGRFTGVNDDSYGFLVSEDGTYPADLSVSTDSPGWQIPTDAAPWSVAGYFGDKPNYAPGPNGHATIEGHLVRNILGDPTGITLPATGNFYPLRGSYIGDPQKGWSGPYMASLPRTDPWGNKYIVNVRNANPTPGTTTKLAVIVLCAGPNRNIETRFDQRVDSFTVGGDDIAFRIK